MIHEGREGTRGTAGELFWQALDELVAAHALTIDRPRGSAHPRYPEMIYPLDYGFLAGTRAADGGGVDVWVGSEAARRVGAVLCCVDLLKGDVELKLLLACTADEMQRLLALHNDGAQAATLVLRGTD